ncbi:hypothetical protein BC829DRAFT_238835 [Chytridium lagenaria]|nr:hypothetical protein BC829DRAFT_238835 [Chytridium lagenaria]
MTDGEPSPSAPLTDALDRLSSMLESLRIGRGVISSASSDISRSGWKTLFDGLPFNSLPSTVTVLCIAVSSNRAAPTAVSTWLEGEPISAANSTSLSFNTFDRYNFACTRWEALVSHCVNQRDAFFDPPFRLLSSTTTGAFTSICCFVKSTTSVNEFLPPATCESSSPAEPSTIESPPSTAIDCFGGTSPRPFFPISTTKNSASSLSTIMASSFLGVCSGIMEDHVVSSSVPPVGSTVFDDDSESDVDELDRLENLSLVSTLRQSRWDLVVLMASWLRRRKRSC